MRPARRPPSPDSPNPKTVVISGRVSFEVSELIDAAARILSTPRRPVKRNQVLLEGGKRLAGIVVRSGGSPATVRRFRRLLKDLAAVDGTLDRR